MQITIILTNYDKFESLNLTFEDDEKFEGIIETTTIFKDSLCHLSIANV